MTLIDSLTNNSTRIAEQQVEQIEVKQLELEFDEEEIQNALNTPSAAVPLVKPRSNSLQQWPMLAHKKLRCTQVLNIHRDGVTGLVMAGDGE